MSKPGAEQAEFRTELRRILHLIEKRIASQRASGRALADEPLRAMAIDDSEAEELAAELSAVLAQPPPPEPDWQPADKTTGESPLRRSRRVFQMQNPEFDALVLAMAVEVDPGFCRIVAYLSDHIARTRPTVGLILSLTGCQLKALELCQRPAIRKGLLRTDGEGPLPGLALRVAPEFLPRLAGQPGAAPLPPGVRLRCNGPNLDELVAGPARRAQLSRWAEQICSGETFRPLVLAGPHGSGRATAALAASSRAGRPIVEVEWAAENADRPDRLAIAAREALWHDASLLIRVGDNRNDTDFGGIWPRLAIWDLPVAIALPPDLIESACSAAPIEPAVIHFDGTTIEQREALWERLLREADCGGQISVTECADLAARYDFLPGTIARAVRRAVADRTENHNPLDFESLSRACRAVGTAGMGPIAQRLAQPYTRADLILPQSLHNELDLACAWIRNRRCVFEDWGFGRRTVLGQGLTALFAGDPGTGKTMAAQVLARELGLDLFRVDLSRVMSKYIGETEKNLSRLFDDARASGAILFFDEADALFGKRTEVKDAHDRYANLEIGYLLQRMEEHAGVTLLATNRMGDLDEAFTRRFHFILDFPTPRPPERRKIWEGMLPRGADLEPGIDFDTLALNYEISGGEIRNSVLSAAFMAAEEGVPIGLRHLKKGLRRELLKTGRVLDGKQRRELEGN